MKLQLMRKSNALPRVCRCTNSRTLCFRKRSSNGINARKKTVQFSVTPQERLATRRVSNWPTGTWFPHAEKFCLSSVLTRKMLPLVTYPTLIHSNSALLSSRWWQDSKLGTFKVIHSNWLKIALSLNQRFSRQFPAFTTVSTVKSRVESTKKLAVLDG